MDMFAPHGAIKSTLWPASRKTILSERYEAFERKGSPQKANV